MFITPCEYIRSEKTNVNDKYIVILITKLFNIMTISKCDMLEKYKYKKTQQLKRKTPCPEM